LKSNKPGCAPAGNVVDGSVSVALLSDEVDIDVERATVVGALALEPPPPEHAAMTTVLTTATTPTTSRRPLRRFEEDATSRF
jgi:uncharacterized protein with PIN domain